MGTTQERWPEIEWSAREREVIELIGRGRTNGEIAERLGISFHTAKWHVSEVISKLGVNSREEVADYWRKQRGVAAHWRRFGRALAMIPMLKAGLGGTAAVGLAGVAILVGGWTARPAESRAYPGGDHPQELPPTPTAVAATVSSPGESIVGLPDGCPTVSTTGPEGLICDWRNYPEVVAQVHGEGCDLRDATFNDVVLRNIDLSDCDLTGMRLSGQLLAADASNATLPGAVFEPGGERASHFGAVHGSFRGSDLRGATFRQVLIHGTDFTNADLEGATFEQVGLELHDVRWMNTTCPDGSNSDDEDGDGRTCLNNLE